MKKILALVLAFSVPTSALSLVPTVYAQTEDEVAVARKKFDKALEYEKQGDWTGALALMRDVAKVKSTSQVRFHIALSLENLHRLVEARAEYIGSKEDADIKEGADGSVMSKKAASRIADLDERIPVIELTVPEEVINAKLQIDGGDPVALIVKSTILLDPGEHKLLVYATSRRNFLRMVKVKERDPTLKLNVELPLEEDVPGPVVVTPTPAPIAPPPPRVVDNSSKWDAYPWIFGGIGLAALAVGGVMYAYRDGTIHEMDAACGTERNKCPRNVEDIESRGRTYTSVGNVFLGVGIAAVTTGVVLYVIKPKSKDVATTSVHLAGGPSSLGLSLAGAF